ncbi:phosphoribosylglycinamide formyltransferase [Quadrisphaera sp. INWT6]|uniref:phosphoribosylglycinamide formyltransferase n=1 Tax=Quadrisphaera sp. INWT6 TaxID=2596917 RepID=UPI0018923ABA|nr:phosphoribosylglycinamide formyltransferase [Quadrisphaera sp. INWT6]MBF5081617.1 phosphoribosylglycinamide formyltransferase [Quadrisphaera sp. INWT6]
MTGPDAPPRQAPARVVVLASGSGTLLQALLDAAAVPGAPFAVVAVGADSAQRAAPALARAERSGTSAFVVELRDHPDRAAWDAALAAELARHRPDLVVSAGFMRVLGASVLDAFGGRVVNTHPALLPSFPGAHGVRDALAHGVKVTGSTVHLVDAGVDTGPVLAQRAVEVLDDDDEAALHERIKTVERALLVDVVTRMTTGGWTVEGRKARLS